MLMTLTILAASAVAPPTPFVAPYDTLTIKEWKVPWERTRPRDPFVAPDGRIWFCGQAGNYIAMFDPRNDEFKRFELPPQTNPHNLIVDKDGIVWFAGNRSAYIGRLDPRTGAIKQYPMPDPAAADPHTLTFDRGGNIWFTVQNGGFVGHLDTRSGKVDLVKMPGEGPRPYGIWMDSKDRPWFNLFGTNKIGTIEPKTMALKAYTLPHERARSRRIAVTSDDMIWYVDYTRGFVGRLDPTSGKVDEIASPGGGNSFPYALTVDDKDRLWYAETAANKPNRIIGYDTKSRTFVPGIEVPSGGGSVRHIIYHRPTKSLWFGTDANTLAQVRLP